MRRADICQPSFALLMLFLAWWPGGPFRNPSHFAFRHLIGGGAVIYFEPILSTWRCSPMMQAASRSTSAAGLAADAYRPVAYSGSHCRRAFYAVWAAA